MTQAETAPPGANAKLAILMSGNVLMTFMISSVMPASGAIAAQFAHLGHADLRAQVVLLAPYVAMIFAAPWSGALIKRLGRRVPLLFAIALYAVAGAAELFISEFWQLMAARVLLGAAGGAISTISMTLAGDYYVGERRTWAVALVGMASAPGSVVVLLVSGILVDRGGWHLAFAPYLLAIPVFVAALLVIREPQNAAEISAERDALPKFFWALCVIALFEACIAILPAVLLPFLLIGIGVRDATTASILIALSATIAVVTGSLYPVLRRHVSVSNILVLIFGAAAVAYVTVAMATGVVGIALGLMIAGFPVGLMIPHFSSLAIERASRAARGRAVGVITGAIMLGQLLIPFVSAPLRALLGMQGMFEALAVLLAAAAIFAAAAPRFARALHASS